MAYLTKSSFPEEMWNSYEFQIRNSITTVDGLAQWINLSDSECEAIQALKDIYKFRISPYYASLMHKTDLRCPLRLQAIPSQKESLKFEGSSVDPVGDRQNLKTARVIHKYPNRVAFLVSDICPVYCRHCTRKYHTTSRDGTYFGPEVDHSMDRDLEYIRSHTEIDDVLLTGGDPLSLGDAKLEFLISRLRSIPHINIIRIGSRFPVVLPQRITPKLLLILSTYGPIWVNTQFNHPSEITQESAAAVESLIRHGIPVQNQSVLLKGINDSLDVMRALIKQLVKIKVRPYYLYHCDNIVGVSHFRTSIGLGTEIMEGLTGFETGFSVPQYVVATRLGKIPITPIYFQCTDEGKTIIRNYKKEISDITSYMGTEQC